MDLNKGQLLSLQKEARGMSRLTMEALFDLRHGREDAKQYLLIREQARVLYRVLLEVFGKPGVGSAGH